MNITDPQASTAAPKKDLTSEQGEREGKDFGELSRVAPSGFAGESEDRALPVRARGVGASEDSRQRTARAPTDDGGDVSPYKSGRIKLSGLGYRMLLKVAFLLALFLFAKQHGMF